MDAVQADILATNIVNIPADFLAKAEEGLTGMFTGSTGQNNRSVNLLT